MDTARHVDSTMMDSEPIQDTHLPHDSMVTVRLSEPPSLTIDTKAVVMSNPQTGGSEIHTPLDTAEVTADETVVFDSSLPNRRSITNTTVGGERIAITHNIDNIESLADSDERRGSDSSEASADGEVNWAELEKTEEKEPRDQDSEDSTALLLARLEQENNLLVTNPKSGLAPSARAIRRNSQSRPPSMQQLKKLVNGPTPPALRYSLIPAPPMTDLEFYTALVQDYKRTAQRLPTLLSRKIRSGVPPPLRGVVWQSMSGARDRLLEEQYDRLCGESSPYEGMIGKDIGRSFPGVEMFRDPEGDGQQMLGRVLKCFSLYDYKIGYCQGLGFLVGPLLMHMGDKQAFCVLVRLMEHYDLRSCFLPDLSGLHVRIYQFRELLKRHLPTLDKHLEMLQIEPTYVSQWFLSFFAVTCPLPMLFRIYDVIFAEGASETIMRVALSVMRKNEEKILACTEFEDVMQLLLSRGLWDCYHYNADDFVNDFVSLTGIVTNESLQALKAAYKDSRALDAGVSPSPDIGSAASRFLGRLWSGSNSSTKSANLSPGLSAPSRPVSFLRRSASKQSIASTLNSTEGGADSITSSTSTDATTVSRDSSNTDSSSVRGQSAAFTNIMVPALKSSGNNDKNLHGQIEDLLTALSEMQRDHAILATQLQKEREEREEDRHAVRSLLDGLRKKTSSKASKSAGSECSLETITPSLVEDTEDSEIDISPGDAIEALHEGDVSAAPEQLDDDTMADMTQDRLSGLLEIVEERFAKRDNRRSSMLQSKSQLRDELARSKEQLIFEVSKSQELSRRLNDMDQEVFNLKEQVKEGHNHVRNAHQEKQRLEKQLHDLRSRKTPVNSPDIATPVTENEWPKRASGHAGLRELRLGRANSNRSQVSTFGKRTSSLNPQVPNLKEGDGSLPSPDVATTPPAADVDALVLELVQAKTAEAIAKQEAEESKAKLESLRKLLGMGGGDSLGHRPSPSQPNIEKSMTLGAFSSYMSRTSEMKPVTPPVTTPSAATSGGGFWGGWGKRSVSTDKVALAQDKA